MGDWETTDLENLKKLFTRFNIGRTVPHTDRKTIKREEFIPHVKEFITSLDEKLPLGYAVHCQQEQEINNVTVIVFNQKTRRAVQQFGLQWLDNQVTWSVYL